MQKLENAKKNKQIYIWKFGGENKAKLVQKMIQKVENKEGLKQEQLEKKKNIVRSI